MTTEEKALGLLESLATKLGQTIESLWPHAVRYVVVDGIVGILFGTLLTGVGIVLTKNALRIHKDSGTWENDGLLMALTFAIAACLIVGPILIFSHLGQVIEPVGYLVRHTVGGAK